jgi:hypothetical protein
MNGPPTLKLQPPHGEIPPSFWELHGWQLGLAALAVLLLMFVIVLLVRWPRQIILELPAVTARRALETLRGRPGDGKLAVEVSAILRRYVRAVFEFPPDELTTTELRQSLQSHPQVNPDLAAAIGDFFVRCDEWKFAPAPPARQPASVPEALDLLEKIEMNRRHMPSSPAA